MTIEELAALGITHKNSRLHPRGFNIPRVGSMDISVDTTPSELFYLIYRRGVSDGQQQGAENKAEEIRNALGL